MKISELVEKEVDSLPVQLQEEVLDFIGYLKTKHGAAEQASEEREWFSLSLDSALKGIEHDTFPDYGETDLVERWR